MREPVYARPHDSRSSKALPTREAIHCLRTCLVYCSALATIKCVCLFVCYSVSIFEYASFCLFLCLSFHMCRIQLVINSFSNNSFVFRHNSLFYLENYPLQYQNPGLLSSPRPPEEPDQLVRTELPDAVTMQPMRATTKTMTCPRIRCYRTFRRAGETGLSSA
jgi:hypothetical protein